MYELIMKFQEDYPTREAKAKALAEMTDEEIDALIEDSPNIYQKISFSKFKKNREERFNPNHDKKTGQFTFGKSGGSGGSKSKSSGGAGGKDSSDGGRKYGETDTDAVLEEINAGHANSMVGYLDRDGNLIPKREKVHKKYIDDTLKGKKPVEGQATMVMLGGGPSSGKTSVLNSEVKMDNHWMTVNPDKAKEALPRYKQLAAMDGKAAGYFHEESSALAKRLHQVASAENYNVIYDGTGDGSVKSLRKKMKTARDNGYRVEGKYVTVDTDEAVRRNQKRYDDAVAAGETPRLPNEKYVRNTHAKVTDISVAMAPEFDHIEIWDNNGEFGEHVKIAEGGNGKYLSPVAGQESKFMAYLAKGKKGTDGFEFLADGQVKPKS